MVWIEVAISQMRVAVRIVRLNNNGHLKYSYLRTIKSKLSQDTANLGHPFLIVHALSKLALAVCGLMFEGPQVSL